MDNEREEQLRTRVWSDKVRSENAPEPERSELRESRRQSAEFNARVHQVLAEIPVPSTLRDQICARRSIIKVEGWGTRARKQPWFWAMAAALAILATGLIFWIQPLEDTTYAGFRSRMVAFAIREYSMDIHTNQLSVVKSYLARTGAPADFQLPSPLAQAPVKGGKKLSWQGRPVGMVCFTAAQGQTLYMFVIDSSHAPNAAEREMAKIKNLSTATWQAGGKTFLLAGNVPIEELENLVRS